VRDALFFLILIFLTGLSSASAQTEFIKYKKYLIPVNSTVVDTEACPELSTTKTNIFYLDDFGVPDQDPNGYLDLAIVLGLSEKHSDSINLVGVGVGVSGKREGLGYESVKFASISQAKKMYASAMGVSTNNTKVYSGAALTNKIIALAACSTPGHKLVLALGGLWHDAYYPLKDSSTRGNVYVVGITGSNLGESTVSHPGKGGQTPSESVSTTACEAFRLVYGDSNVACGLAQTTISNTSTVGIGVEDFDGIFRDTNIPGDAIYDRCLEPFFKVSLGTSIAASISSDLNNESKHRGHRLRIADYGAFALGAGLGSTSNLFTQAFLNNEIKEALRELPGVTASCN